jgi:hypothetical protein
LSATPTSQRMPETSPGVAVLGGHARPALCSRPSSETILRLRVHRHRSAVTACMSTTSTAQLLANHAMPQLTCGRTVRLLIPMPWTPHIAASSARSEVCPWFPIPHAAGRCRLDQHLLEQELPHEVRSCYRPLITPVPEPKNFLGWNPSWSPINDSRLSRTVPPIRHDELRIAGAHTTARHVI